MPPRVSVLPSSSRTTVSPCTKHKAHKTSRNQVLGIYRPVILGITVTNKRFWACTYHKERENADNWYVYAQNRFWIPPDGGHMPRMSEITSGITRNNQDVRNERAGFGGERATVAR